MSLAAVPAYLIARRVVGQWLGAARGAARGRGAVDGLHGDRDDRERVLPGLPARGARARARSSSARRGSTTSLFFAALGLAFLTRSQAIVVAAAAVDGAAAPRRLPSAARSGRRLAPTAGSTRSSCGGAVLVVAAQTARGHAAELAARLVLRRRDRRHYDLGKRRPLRRLPRAELDLYLGVVPVAAAIVLTARARSSTAPLQVLLAATIVARRLDVLVVGTFASRVRRPDPGAEHLRARAALPDPPARLGRARRAPAAGRSAPLRGRCRGAARPRDPVRPASSRTSAVSDTLMLLPWWAIAAPLARSRGSGGSSFLGAVAFAAAFLFLPRRLALALPLIVLAYWLAASKPSGTARTLRRQAGRAGALFQGIRGVQRDWIDRAVPGRRGRRRPLDAARATASR